MTDPRDQRLGSLYRAGAREEPSSAADRRILAAARRAVDPARARFTPFGGHWPLAVSAAAVVVMATTLLVYLVDTTDPYLDETSVPMEEGAPAPRREAAPQGKGTAPKAEQRAPAPSPGNGAGRPAPLRELKRSPATAARERAYESLVPVPRSAPAPAMDAADGPRDEAAEVLHRVRELLAAGERTAARRLLEEFVARFPDRALPPDLRALVDSGPDS